MNDQCLLGQACAAEEKSSAMNLMSSDHKANSKKFNDNYDKIDWSSAPPVIPERPSLRQWYGYRHVNSTLHVKRFMSMADLDEAWASDFTLAVFGPFEAEDYKTAMTKLNAYVAMVPHGVKDIYGTPDNKGKLIGRIKA